MKLLPHTGNKLQPVQAVLPARATGHNLPTSKSPFSSSAYVLSLPVGLALGSTILLLGFDATNSLYAASATAPQTRTAAEIGAGDSDSNALRTQPFGKPIPNKTGRLGGSGRTSAMPVSDPHAQQAQDEQQMLPARNTSPLRITRQQFQRVEPLLQAAYLAYGDGKLEQAQQLYLAMFRKDMHNSDALLGLATIALQHGDSLSAAQYYTRMLMLDPHNAMANAGMAALSADDGSNESRLKILLQDQSNAAILHFALGNLYARQTRWSEAQQAYFSAYALEPGNAAFAFNLAVSLDHLGQRDQAALRYQRAMQLDQANNAGLDHAHIAQRLTELQH